MNFSLDLTGLQVTLDGETDIRLRRDFSHPPAKIWRALTEPALLQQWLASRDAMIRCEIDLRPGGSFRYEWAEFFFCGPILEVDAPHHMTHIEYFNGDKALEQKVITDLAPRGTGTRMTMVMRYAHAEARAQAIATGLADGMDEVYARLEALQIAD